MGTGRTMDKQRVGLHHCSKKVSDESFKNQTCLPETYVSIFVINNVTERNMCTHSVTVFSSGDA